MQSIFREPLLHFAVAGAALFMLYGWLNRDAVTEASVKRIVVDETALVDFIQNRTRAFNEEAQRDLLAELSDEELKLLIDDYIREEALHREAIAMDLNEGDYIIRRRLVQKMEFISESVSADTATLTDNDVAAYYEENKDEYFTPPRITFAHVYFDAEKHGWDEARKFAEAKRDELNAANAGFDAAVDHGDRYPFGASYVDRDANFVTTYFSPVAADEMFELEADNQWHGPIDSLFGAHVVLVSEKTDARLPELDEIIDRVREDAMYNAQQSKTQAAIDDIVNSYDVVIDYDPAGAAQ